MLKLIGDKKTEQTAGDGGQNYSATGNIVINNGIDEKRAREIVHEMMRSEIISLSEEAKQEAEKRSRDFEDKFVARIEKFEGGYESLSRPEIQFSLLEAKRNYAQSADDASCDVTIEMIADYIGKDATEASNPIFREAISVAPKLNERLLDVLTTLFLLTNTNTAPPSYIEKGFSTYSIMKIRWDRISPLINVSNTNSIEFQILDTYRIVSRNPISDFTYNRFAKSQCSILPKPLNSKQVEEFSQKYNFNPFVEVAHNIHFLFPVSEIKKNHPNLPATLWDGIDDIKNDINNESPDENQSAAIFNTLDKSDQVSSFFDSISGGWSITPVGLAIALSNLKKRGLSLDDRIWLGGT